jgi:hypothetical protein
VIRTLPVVSKEVTPFVSVILFVVVAELSVTACKLPATALAFIFDNPPPSPIYTAPDMRFISNGSYVTIF